jgi:hypothetical protein
VFADGVITYSASSDATTPGDGWFSTSESKLGRLQTLPILGRSFLRGREPKIEAGQDLETVKLDWERLECRPLAGTCMFVARKEAGKWNARCDCGPNSRYEETFTSVLGISSWVRPTHVCEYE